MRTLMSKRQRGIGLIEVMIAAVIFALGSIAIIQLQGNFFKSSNAALGRTMAMNIAEEKLEDLRNFENFDDADADVFDFTSIAPNAGGQCDINDDAACVNTLQCTSHVYESDGTTIKVSCPTESSDITVNNLVFERSWDVTDYYYDASGALTTTATGNVVQKSIAVLVTWTDTDGSDQTLTADTVINSNSVSSGGVIVSNAGGSGESPEVPYTPSTEDRVTPIEVGTSSKRETLVPISETVDGYTRTQFTAYTYNSSNVLLRQEEFQNVACDCRFDGTSSSGSETYGAAHAEWNTTKDTYVDVDGDLVAGKVKGCVQGGGSNCASNPDALCEVCCRDHHDDSSVTRKYDPYRSSDDFDSSTGNHKHYSGSSVVTSGQYQESCRLKRIDGFWRVYQDWHSVNFEALPLTDLSNATTKASYATYVKAIVDAHLDESKVSGETLTTPPTEPTAINHNVVANYVSMSVGDIAEISGRGLYLDYMDATHLSNVQSKKGASQDYLLHVPFYEVEVVEVTDWSSADDSIVAVGPVDNPGNSNDILVGEMKAEATDTNPVVISASLRKSNTGLTSMNVSLDYDAATNPDSDEQTDSLTVCVGCSGAATTCTTPWSTTVIDTTADSIS